MYRITQIDHTADAAFIIEADSKAELVGGSIEALMMLLGLPDFDDHTRQKEIRQETVAIEGKIDSESLVEVLNEWLFLVQTRGFLPSSYAIRWDENGVRIKSKGIFTEDIYPLPGEVKAVTYHQAEVTPPEGESSLWKAFWIADL